MINDTPKLKEFFLSLGYNESDFSNIISSCCVKNHRAETLIKKVGEFHNLFLTFGYKEEDIIMMGRKMPTIYIISVEKLKQKIEYMISLGYSDSDIIRITKALPQMYGLPIEYIEQKINDFKNLGYEKEDIIKMSKKAPVIYSYSIDNIKKKIDDLISLGYTKEEVTEMLVKTPQLYGHSIDNINQKIEDIESLGYTREEVLKMTKILPALYTYSIENIKQKVDFYDSVGLRKLTTEKAACLMQSVELSYARYMFYKEKNIGITMDNYIRLFMSNEQFEKQYGVTKNMLLKKYNYEEYLEQKNKKRKVL